MKFGTCGLEVLENGPEVRVSMLYSVHDEVRVCRTFAVVVYPEVIDPALRKEHEAIRGGLPIGMVFRENGWLIEKRHHYFGRQQMLPGGPEAHPIFGDIGRTQPAVHVYSFVARKDHRAYHYAFIAEVHHPQHLGYENLQSIYGRQFEDYLVKNKDVCGILEILDSKVMALSKSA